MKIVLLYLRIIKKWDTRHPEHKSYENSSRNFLKCYQQFKPEIPHELVVVNCGSEEHDGLLDPIATRYATYSGGGYDCGTYQAIAPSLDCDLVMAMNTHAILWRHGWLMPFAYAAKVFPVGVYGATASYEQSPHLRTPCIAFHPRVMSYYPYLVDSREKAAHFEAGGESFSMWALNSGFPSVLVTADGIYHKPEWRSPANIFRRGDQSNCLVWDRHTEIYANAGGNYKRTLEAMADGG